MTVPGRAADIGEDGWDTDGDDLPEPGADPGGVAMPPPGKCVGAAKGMLSPAGANACRASSSAVRAPRDASGRIA